MYPGLIIGRQETDIVMKTWVPARLHGHLCVIIGILRGKREGTCRYPKTCRIVPFKGRDSRGRGFTKLSFG